MEFLRSFLRRHLAGKPVVASPNVGCFLRPNNSPRSIYQDSNMIPARFSGHFFLSFSLSLSFSFSLVTVFKNTSLGEFPYI